jgi:hypothetical protein
MNLHVGETILAFDDIAWQKNGGDSKTDDFYRPAIIGKVYIKMPRSGPMPISTPVLVDVEFVKSGRVSKGIMATSLKEVK